MAGLPPFNQRKDEDHSPEEKDKLARAKEAKSGIDSAREGLWGPSSTKGQATFKGDQASAYADKIIKNLRIVTDKDGIDQAVTLLKTLNNNERKLVEEELSHRLHKDFRQWLRQRVMPVGHHQIRHSNEDIARIETALDAPEGKADFAGHVKVLLGRLQDTRSKDVENALLHVVAGLDAKEIRESGLIKPLRQCQVMSENGRSALDTLLAGRDVWTKNEMLSRELAELGLKTKNVDIFKDAMQSAKARQFYATPAGSKHIDEAFSAPWEARDKEIAHDYAKINDTQLLTDLRMYQFSVHPSPEAITERLKHTSESERKLFLQGRHVADNTFAEKKGKDLEAHVYHNTVDAALHDAAKGDTKLYYKWRRILSGTDKETEKQATEIDQIIADNKANVSGLEAVRHLEAAVKKYPDLEKRLPKDELNKAFERIAASAQFAAVSGEAWKDLTNPENLNPMSMLTSLPERFHQKQEMGQAIIANSAEALRKQCLSQGHFSLEQKLFIAGQNKLTAQDLLSLPKTEKQALLNNQYAKAIQQAVFGDSKQQEFVKEILAQDKPELSQLETIRAFAVGLGDGKEKIERLLQTSSAEQRKHISDAYFHKYKSLMTTDVLNKVDNPVDKTRMAQFLRHAVDTDREKLLQAQVEQTRHRGAFDWASEAWSPDQRLTDKYLRNAENFYQDFRAGLTDKQKTQFDNLPPEKKQQLSEALERFWATQKDALKNKEEFSEASADAALTVVAVGASILQPELSLALVARCGAMSAIGRVAIKESVMGTDFDRSPASYQKELYKGGMAGIINAFGGEVFTTGRLMPMSKFAGAASNAAEKTIAHLSKDQAIKSVLAADAEQLLASNLEKTGLDKVFGTHGACMQDARQLARQIAPGAGKEQTEIIAQTIQAQRRAEILSSSVGKTWHEADQFGQSIAASAAGATLTEVASTAAGYESSTTLWDRIKGSAAAGAVGGAIFHGAIKTTTAGAKALPFNIGKDKGGHFFIGKDTYVRERDGTVRKISRPYEFYENVNQAPEILTSTTALTDAAYKQSNDLSKNGELNEPFLEGTVIAGTGRLVSRDGTISAPWAATLVNTSTDKILQSTFKEAEALLRKTPNISTANKLKVLAKLAHSKFDLDVDLPPAQKQKLMDDLLAQLHNTHKGEGIAIGEFIQRGIGGCTQESVLFKALCDKYAPEANAKLISGNGVNAGDIVNHMWVQSGDKIYDLRRGVIGDDAAKHTNIYKQASIMSTKARFRRGQIDETQLVPGARVGHDGESGYKVLAREGDKVTITHDAAVSASREELIKNNPELTHATDSGRLSIGAQVKWRNPTTGRLEDGWSVHYLDSNGKVILHKPDAITRTVGKDSLYRVIPESAYLQPIPILDGSTIEMFDEANQRLQCMKNTPRSQFVADTHFSSPTDVARRLVELNNLRDQYLGRNKTQDKDQRKQLKERLLEICDMLLTKGELSVIAERARKAAELTAKQAKQAADTAARDGLKTWLDPKQNSDISTLVPDLLDSNNIPVEPFKSAIDNAASKANVTNASTIQSNLKTLGSNNKDLVDRLIRLSKSHDVDLEKLLTTADLGSNPQKCNAVLKRYEDALAQSKGLTQASFPQLTKEQFAEIQQNIDACYRGIRNGIYDNLEVSQNGLDSIERVNTSLSTLQGISTGEISPATIL